MSSENSNRAADATAMELGTLESVQLDTQPARHQAMDPQRPHPETEMNLRGGDLDQHCPGRFCFIPCPLNCRCFIIPIPCC